MAVRPNGRCRIADVGGSFQCIQCGHPTSAAWPEPCKEAGPLSLAKVERKSGTTREEKQGETRAEG